MSIVNKITRRHLKENKKRTLITIMGTIISVAMIMAVATLGSTFQDVLKRNAIENAGDWHAAFEQVNQTQLQAIRESDLFDDVALIRESGYAEYGASTDSSKPYVYVTKLNETGFDTMQLELVEGRFPSGPDEVIVSEQLMDIGSEIHLEMGERVAEDITFDDERTHAYALHTVNGERAERLTNVTEDSFSVVGVVREPLWQHSWTPGYPIIGHLDEGEIADDSTAMAYMSVSDVDRTIYDQVNTFAEEAGLEQPFYNDSLLRAHGLTASDNMQTTLYGLMAIVMVIIVIGSVALIFNSFAISVSERSRYLGMLSSVGATKRQKRNSVYFEGLIIGLIAIPIGIVAGVAGIGVTTYFINDLLSSALDTELRMVVSKESVFISIGLAAMTIFISTIIPALRASRITAVDAIRQSQDVKLTKKKVKTNRLVRKLFGVEGDFALKNLKRNNKRYFVTVSSLVVSIILFLSISYFASALSQSMHMSFVNQNYDLSIQVDRNDDEFAAIVDQVLNMDSVNEGSVNRSVTFRTLVEPERWPEGLTNQVEDNMDYLIDGNYPYHVQVIGLDADSFSEYATSIGADTERFIGADETRAILVSEILYEDTEAGRYVEEPSVRANENDTFTIEQENYDEERELYEYEDVVDVEIGAITNDYPLGYFEQWLGSMVLIVSPDVFEDIQTVSGQPLYDMLYVTTDQPEALQQELEDLALIDEAAIHNTYAQEQRDQQITTVMSIFLYGFITLISMIAIANIINTISTSIALRRREFAMLKSIGMTPRSFNKMIYFESIFYGLKALLYGLPISIGIMYSIYITNQNAFAYAFTLPWLEIIIAIVAVLVIVIVAMIYSMSKIKKDNIIETLKQENV
ncbi:ABC transporter [Geomicrobium sp. JCM 19037]|uniref:ABC transporter permease n=1 Tax=Geomicrobium sp. JCM 19037 TaxID=1460634 RepID=UPI00045F21A1|nr:FtsX-like permease family protein [Geomicrobium sp. JCM 19037]GAK04432.1 ABC transporter [Geomicrobium sp. JCM 19037]